MSQFARHPAYLMIEDTLDAVGQKYRAQRIVRGFMLFAVLAGCLTFAAAILAHFIGAGKLTTLITATWFIALAISAFVWIARPLFIRPKDVEVARLVESRIPDMHNGLTNGVQLARADDLQHSPWIGPILDEIMSLVRARPVSSAVKMSDLKPLSLRLGLAILPLLLLLLIPGVRIALEQGFRQMFSPAAFVPKVGAVRIIELTPKEITLITGQPLEISLLAEHPDKSAMPAATIIFDNNKLPKASMSPTLTADDQLKYGHRIDRVEEPLRFRVEVGGTQSDWCIVNLVKQVKLTELLLNITPPTYTGKPSQSLNLKPVDIEKNPLAVLEGSRVEISTLTDVPVASALLALNNEAPIPMTRAQQGQRFSAAVTLMQNSELSALLNENGQVIARIPDPSLKVAVTKDTAPSIEMKWPTQDLAVAPKSELKIRAILRDDHGLQSGRILVSTSPDQPLVPVHEVPFAAATRSAEVTQVLNIPDKFRIHGGSITVQIEATDNRNLSGLSGASAKETGPQTTSSPVYQIKFRDPEELAKEQKAELDKLRALLQEMLKKQKDLHTPAISWKPTLASAAKGMKEIQTGQSELRKMMQLTAESFPFSADDRIVQKTLLVLYQNQAREAVEIAQGILTEPIPAEKLNQNKELQARQRRIIDTLETLLSRLEIKSVPNLAQQKNGADLDNQKEKYKELNEALKKFLAEEKRILDSTSTLAKKPVDNWDDKDKKLLEELKQSQEKLDKFMQEKLSDFSKLAEQDMANASLLKEMMETYSEVTMAKDALKKGAVELAIPLEEMGMELAKEISSNLEKWLSDKPDREKWNQEDMVGKQDIPMAELPKELEDMVGELMEDQEDLFEEMEDTAANWADSIDKGAGWDAADGPIANMSAKGVTGNQNPNNNEMNGRSGEGRSGKSSGEFVEESATGKGGRNTPTRLDATPFQKGQVKDTGKDPTGGATGGGKISGQGGAGLEGPVPPKDLRDKMQRLAGKQAELRNKVERLNLDKKAAAYDNFKLMEAAALMRRIEADVKSFRYNNALRRKDIVLDRLDESKALLEGQIHAKADTSPTTSKKLQDELNDVINGQLPAAWSDALKEYYKKLAAE